jgi:ABC-type multidrug transport system fused ATPase/permease subunit
MQKPTEDLAFSWWDTIKSVYFLLDTKRKAFLFYTIILIIVLIYDLVPTIIIAKVIDFFASYTQDQSLRPFYIWILILSVSWGIVALIRLTVKKKLANIRVETGYFTRIKGFERLLDFSIKWHDKENTGNKVQKIQAGTEALKQVQVVLIGEAFQEFTNIIAILVAFVWLNPLFLGIALLYIGIFLVVQWSFYSRILKLNNENNILLEKAGGTYFEGLNNILTIKTLGVKDDFKRNIASKEDLTREHSIRRIELINNKWKLFQIINAVMIGATLYLAGRGYVAGAISIGTMVIIYNYFQRLSKSVQDSTDTIEKLILNRTILARMMPIFWEKTTALQGTEAFPRQWETISIKDAVFKYPRQQTESESDNDIPEIKGNSGLAGITLHVHKNEKIGIVGKSGSGKSTLAKILLGLYELESGSYQIGEKTFGRIKHEEITKHMALVLQDSEMFNLSFKENITLMRTWSKELFEKAVAVAELGELIAKLPNSIDTLIGEKGYRLSGGERQRLGIARAIYKDPQILILDEATSSLDTKTEIAIQKSIETRLSEKTIITIAHRISTLENTDRIIVFEDGKIVEEGTYNSLSTNPHSHFSKIYREEGRETFATA